MPTTEQEKAAGWVSVSEVLDGYAEQGIIDWKIKVGKKEARRIGTIALKIGTRIHELIEQDWKEGKYKFKTADPVEVKNCIKAWEQFKLDYKPEIKSMETEVKDDVRLVVGHQDALMQIGQYWVVVDFKTSSQINSKHWLQINKYAGMGQIQDRVAVLRLDKNLGVYEYQERQFDESLVEVFDCMTVAHRYFNPNGAEMEIQDDDTSDPADRGF